ncbi:TrmH family RNA methyltransferase [Demequina sediminicola]|uniref:TrmH family RNA methyltransferase n=1 Tax=Demequina sediminicola TaxID=1095026 RepID=UPI000A6E7D83|nr:RNA methyltransferase [Demequina sediminicola]
MITDPADPLLDDYRNLTDVALRRKIEPERGLYMAEGAKVIERALAAGHVPRSVLASPKWATGIREVMDHMGVSAPLLVGAEELLENVTGYQVHRGALAAMHRPSLADPQELVATARRVVVLEGIVDHTNVGAIFRSAAGIGADAIICAPTCADPLYRRAVKVSMGTVFQVPWTRFEAWPQGIELLQDEGYVVAGMTLGAGAITLDELVAEDHEKLAIVLGSEGHGITPKVDRRLDRRVTIPMMNGVDSLNVAAASAVVFYATR